MNPSWWKFCNNAAEIQNIGYGNTVTVNGGATTTAVTVDQTVDGAGSIAAVTITDKLAGRGTGTISTVNLSGMTPYTIEVTPPPSAGPQEAGAPFTLVPSYAVEANIYSDALTTLNLSDTNQNVTVHNTRAHTLSLSLDNVLGASLPNTDPAPGEPQVTPFAGIITDATATVLNVAATGEASSGVTLDAALARTVNISGDADLSTSGQTFHAQAVITNTGTGDVLLGSDLLTTQTYVGGSGSDMISLAGVEVTSRTVTTTVSTTKAITTGAGDDFVALKAAALGTGGSVNGGVGFDTLMMDSGDAASLTTKRANGVTNFEKLVLGVTSTATPGDVINLANLAGVTHVVSTGVETASALTLDNMANGGTLELLGFGAGEDPAAAPGDTTVDMEASGPNDVLNLVLTNAYPANVPATPDDVTGHAFGTVSVVDADPGDGVETINITTNDIGENLDVAATVDTLTLVATSATTVTVSGNNGLTLLNDEEDSNSAITLFDASGVMADGVQDTPENLSVTFTSTNADATASVTIIGGEGNDFLTGAAAKDDISGGNGADAITGGAGGDRLTGGKEADSFIFLAATDSGGLVGNRDVITDFVSGEDVLDFVGLNLTNGTYLGEAEGLVDVELALTGVAGEAVLDSQSSILYVDVSGDGNVGSGDIAIKLTGITELSSDDFLWTAGL